jgi:hypothetical protein
MARSSLSSLACCLDLLVPLQEEVRERKRREGGERERSEKEKREKVLLV